MTDYAGLQTEIAKPEYAGMTDAQIAASITMPFTYMRDTPAIEAFNILQRAQTGDWGRIVTRSQMALSGNPIVIPIVFDPGEDPEPFAAGKPNNDALIILAKNLVSTYQSDRTILYTSNQADFDVLNNEMTMFQYAGDIVAASFNAIHGLPYASTTRAAQLGFTDVHDMTQEIAAARKWTP